MKTLLDLHLSASKAALSSLELPHAHAIATASLDAFKAEAIEPVDFDQWNSYFIAQRNQYLALRPQRLRSDVVAEQKAAADRVAAAKAPAPVAPAAQADPQVRPTAAEVAPGN